MKQEPKAEADSMAWEHWMVSKVTTGEPRRAQAIWVAGGPPLNPLRKIEIL